MSCLLVSLEENATLERTWKRPRPTQRRQQKRWGPPGTGVHQGKPSRGRLEVPKAGCRVARRRGRVSFVEVAQGGQGVSEVCKSSVGAHGSPGPHCTSARPSEGLCVPTFLPSRVFAALRVRGAEIRPRGLSAPAPGNNPPICGTPAAASKRRSPRIQAPSFSTASAGCCWKHPEVSGGDLGGGGQLPLPPPSSPQPEQANHHPTRVPKAKFSVSSVSLSAFGELLHSLLPAARLLLPHFGDRPCAVAIAGGAGVRTRLSGSNLLSAGRISVGRPTAEPWR